MKHLIPPAMISILSILPAAAFANDHHEEQLVKDFGYNFSVADGAMTYYAYKGDALPDIYVKPEHGPEKNLTRRNDTWDIEPDYSPDGRMIIYSSGAGMATMSLRIMAADGSHDRKFYDGPDSEVGATWSPDGSMIAFTAFDNSVKKADVYIVAKDGSHLTNLTNDMDGIARTPSWSSDGKVILFSHTPQGEEKGDVYRMSYDGSHKERLTESDINPNAPVFSPDGSMILFITDGGEHTDIYGMSADGHGTRTELHQITNTPDKSEYFIDFTPNKLHMIYSLGDWDDGFSFAHLPTPRAHH